MLVRVVVLVIVANPLVVLDVHGLRLIAVTKMVRRPYDSSLLSGDCLAVSEWLSPVVFGSCLGHSMFQHPSLEITIISNGESDYY